MSCFLKSGKTFRVSSKEALDLHDVLPPGNYVIKEDAQGNLFLDTIEGFEIKGKRYGDLNNNTERIFSTFMKRPASTGVMLAGEKGSGKSLLAKAVCMKGVEENVPTIMINAPWIGDRFNSFIQSIEQPVVILFDEFEKVYDKNEQEQILTLLDGVFPSKKLFILTCNDKWRIDEHMRNRPGRIYYMLDFKGLAPEFILEYCNDNLLNKNHVEKVCAITSIFSQFNFDMLKALIEEMNRYNEAPELALKMLNIKPEFDQGMINYTVELSIKGKLIPKDNLRCSEWKGNPLHKAVLVHYSQVMTKKLKAQKLVDSEDADIYGGSPPASQWVQVIFSSADLKKIDPVLNKYHFTNKEGNQLCLTRREEVARNYYDF